MRLLATIGERNDYVTYIDRPTVKVVVKRGNKILTLNNGLLPGGGVNAGESNVETIHRELLEELGVIVDEIREVGKVIQYRHFLGKKYIVYGYEANFIEFSRAPTPQDEGEAQFTYRWMTKDESLELIDGLIEKQKASDSDNNNDLFQGRLYNMMTARAIVRAVG